MTSFQRTVPDPEGREPDELQRNLEQELKHVVGLLLSTQQELISLKDRRDREHRVLEGIVGFAEGVFATSGKEEFWNFVVDEAIQTFDCEIAIAAEVIGETMSVLAHRGPAPKSESELLSLREVAFECVERRTELLEGAPIDRVTLAGQPMATLMISALDSGAKDVTRLLVLGVSTRKKPFFPRFDSLSVPGFRMFASTVTVFREMQRSRFLIASQVKALDRANAELQERMAAQQRAAEEQEALRAQLAQSRRMESIGRLAGGVAHDFNNLLTVIVGNAEIVRSDDTLPEDHLESLSQVLEASDRARALTQQLLMFGRKQVIRPKSTDLNLQVNEALKLYRRVIGEDIALRFHPCSEATPILADKQQFDQLLGNLLLNARDAIYERPHNARVGNITVSTSIVLEGSPLHAGLPAVCLTVSDSGIGMDEITRQNIFEPFFTTKSVGQGTGLGLATVLGVVQQNNGVIQVDSARDEGSTFRVYWPLIEHEVAPVSANAGARVGRGNERVFLVEDEDQVRRLMVRGLERLGFTVVAFASGEALIEHLASGATPPDLLVTDIVMPRMNGAQVAEAVLARIPTLPVLFVSGYTDDIVAQQGIVRSGVQLLEKPFTPDVLGQRIRTILDTGTAQVA